MARKNILVVDDEKAQREILEMILSEEGYDVTTAASGEAAIKFAKERRFDLALTDLKMTGMDGIELLQHLLAFDSSIIVILLTAHGSIESAKEALRRGAFDYLEKPYDKKALLETIDRALDRLDAIDTEIISASPKMEAVKKMILKVARSNSTVLIRGESGTGKELIARAVHNQSPRATEMFQAVNCAAINRTFWSRNCLVMKRDRSRAHTRRRRDCLRLRIAAHCFLMKLRSSMSASRQSCCEHCRNVKFDAWAAHMKSILTFA